ncbi:MAG: AMP-binding protein, partial [Lentisphaeria bacterium]|nr:AMP-binding protein [Lentisphaeria bacterium]
MKTSEKSPDLVSIGFVNFLSSLVTACFCAYAALAEHRGSPVFNRQAMNMLLAGALFTLPHLFMPPVTRYLTTRFSSRNNITFALLTNFVLMTAGITVFALTIGVKIALPGIMMLMGMVMLCGMDYTVYRTALRIYVAETVPKAMLPVAGAVTECSTFAGVVAGVIAAGLAAELEISPAGAGVCLTGLSFMALSAATQLKPTLAPFPRLRFSGLPKTWLAVIRKEEHGLELMLTGIGESYIIGAIIFAASLAIQYVSFTFGLHIGDMAREYTIMGAPLAGACGGIILGASLCRKNAEIGLVPPASLMMTLSTFCIGLLPLIKDDIIETWSLGILLLIFGFFAGIVLIPLQAYQKYFVPEDLRSSFFAWFCFPFGLVVIAAIGLSFLMYKFRIEVFPVAMGFSVLTLVIGVISFLLMPQFLLRMCTKLLLLTFYRLKVWNAERIPEQGPALLIANRASFMDMLFVSACTSRPVRFMMDESYYNALPFLRPLLKAVGLVEVPAGKPKKLLQFFRRSRELFRNGELVCVFPEGDITRNGSMSGFKDGMSALLPKDIDVPLIPLHIGMTWGSIFSCYRGKFKFRRFSASPHPASVTVGNPLPRESNAYEIRIAMSELAAETELTPTPEEKPFHSQALFLGRRFPHRCIVGEYDGQKFSLPGAASVAVESIMISRFLRRIVHRNEEYLGVMLPNSIDAVTSMIGIQLTDCTPAMLNYTASAESLRSAVETAKIRHIISSRAFIEKQKLAAMPEMIFIEDIRKHYGGRIRRLLWHCVLRILSSRELMRLLAPASWDDVNKVAVLIFSSGSTGNPKGIMLTHHNITGDVSAVIKTTDWHRSDRILGNLPLFHSFGMNTCLWLPMFTGARVVMIPNALDAKSALTVLKEQQISVLMTTPGFLQIYMRSGKPEDFKSIRLTVAGAEKLRSDIADKYYEMTGLAIAEGFGSTELSPIVSINVATSVSDLGVKVAKRGSIGPALSGVCVKIVDPETFELKPENCDGLLIVKGAIVMKGYLNQPEKTAEVIRDGWYITGD